METIITSSRKNTSFRNELEFPKESLDGLVSPIYVTYMLSREIIRGEVYVRKELDISYNLNGTQKGLGFKREKWKFPDEEEIIDEIVHPVFFQQAELDEKVRGFLEEKLPNYMIKLLPERK